MDIVDGQLHLGRGMIEATQAGGFPISHPAARCGKRNGHSPPPTSTRCYRVESRAICPSHVELAPAPRPCIATHPGRHADCQDLQEPLIHEAPTGYVSCGVSRLLREPACTARRGTQHRVDPLHPPLPHCAAAPGDRSCRRTPFDVTSPSSRSMTRRRSLARCSTSQPQSCPMRLSPSSFGGSTARRFGSRRSLSIDQPCEQSKP